MDMKRKDHKYPDFGVLVIFVKQEAEVAMDPVYGEEGLLKFTRNQGATGGQSVKVGNQQGRSQSSNQQIRSHSTSFVSSKGRTVVLCSFCGQDHRVYMCQSFKALDAGQKMQVIIDKKLCENCLLDNHDVIKCLRPSMCGIDGCKLKHSRFVHSIRKSESESGGLSSGLTDINSDICIPVVPVRVNNKTSSVALLDTCSTGTFMTQRLANKLGLVGFPVKYELNTLNGKGQFKQTNLIPGLFVESESGGERMCLNNVFIVEEIPIRNMTTDVSRFDHLKDLPIPRVVGELGILIGQDNSEALIPLEVRKGQVDQPFAVRTLLGWSLHGHDDCGLVGASQTSRKVVNHFIFANSDYDQIEEKVDRLWSIENEGVDLEKDSMSETDKQVLNLWNENVKVVDEHYELPIPWKPNVSVQNNHELALSRLMSLKSSLDRKGTYSRYDHEIQKLLNKGYAENISGGNCQNSKILYLPHHAVVTEKKTDKLRVVFDCAAQYQGESLNDKCRQGPDLNNKLIHVLLRFRQHRYAVMADVEAMYYQVKVAEADRDALRFLWFDEVGGVVTYRMNAHVFGGVWCACIATYAMRRTLEDQEVEDQLVKDVIMRSFYVDDCLRSVQSREEVAKIIGEVKEVLQNGGFNLTKFVVNDAEALSWIKEVDRAKEVKQLSEGVKSKVLGVGWDVIKDSFYIVVGGLREARTRRDMLSIVASMYDPLGLISPCVILGKMLFQDATRLKLSWSEELPEYLIKEWNRWMRCLDDLKSLSFPRCMKDGEFDEAELELHTFCDASERAYGCCSYLKCIASNGKVSVSLVASKGRICPIKQVSIPRLELQAAVMAAQISDMMCRELDVQVARSYFWSDSQIVLAYIGNTEKRFKIYVANRVSTIRSLTSPKQWKFVPGKDNPADCITRGISPI